MIATKFPKSIRKPKAKIPEYLIGEVMDGKPFYYKGYSEVLSGKKNFSEIMGSGSLQSLIVIHLIILLGRTLDETKFTILSSEIGLHLGKNDNLAGDILIFDNTTLPIEAINEQYVSVPPKVVIKVDINRENPEETHDSYIQYKTQKLLDFGVEKVIWITTKSKKVIVATPDEDWQIKNWNKDIDILEGVTFNIGAYLTQKGSTFA